MSLSKVSPTRFFLLATGIGLLLGLGCKPVDSSDLKTSGMYADFRAGLGPEGVGVSAQLRTGSGIAAEIRLSEGDRLIAFAGAQSFPMTEEAMCDRCLPGIVRPYLALLPQSAATAPVRIAFERDQGTDAPNSVIRLPSPHEITFPPAGMFTSSAPASRAAVGTVTMTWGPTLSDDLVTVNISGCDTSVERPLARGAGQLAFDLRTLRPVMPDLPCDVYFRVLLTRTGTVDPAYGKGGRFTASRERVAVISTVP